MTPLFRPEVLHRRGESEIGQTIQIVPLSQLIFAGFFVAAIAGAAVYAAFAGYARKETVPGLITPSEGVIRVTAPRAGTITAVMVAEGDVVVEDQVLFGVVAEETNASGTGSDTAILEAAKQQKAVIEEQIDSESGHAAAERARLDAQLRDLGATIGQIENERKFQGERTAAARALFDRVAPYKDRGVISGFEFSSKQQAALNEEQNLAALDERLSQKRGDLAQTRLQRERLPIDEAERLATLRRDLAEVAQHVAELEGRRRYIVRAPVPGRVTSLQAAVGRTVDPRLPQMSIVPVGGSFEAELFVPVRAIGFVRPGQHVRLLYDAFPFERFGTYGGTVGSVAAAMLAPGDFPGPIALKDPAYRVKVALDRQSVDAFGRAVPLQPDMTLTADIILEQRSLLDWLFAPLLSARKRLS